MQLLWYPRRILCYPNGYKGILNVFSVILRVRSTGFLRYPTVISWYMFFVGRNHYGIQEVSCVTRIVMTVLCIATNCRITMCSNPIGFRNSIPLYNSGVIYLGIRSISHHNCVMQQISLKK